MALAQKKLFDHLNPKQELFFRATNKYVCYGGARGGGKSWSARKKAVLLALEWPGIQILLMRRTLPELWRNHVFPLLSDLKGIAKYNDDKHTFTFPNGSVIVCGYCEKETDTLQYQGQAFDIIFLEEATMFSVKQFEDMSMCNRPSEFAIEGGKERGEKYPCRMYLTCNPGGIGHAWVKRLFVDRQFTDDEYPDDYILIKASVYDNPDLMEADPSYVKALMRLPLEKRKMMLDGDWNACAGQFFTEFSEKHILRGKDKPKIEDWWVKFRSIDWGYNDPCCCLWHAVDGDGIVYTYREYYKRGVIASAVAKEIKRRTGKEKIRYTAASPDMWQTRGMGKKGDTLEGENIADTFDKNGVFVTRADNSRELGWMRMHEYLGDPNGDPVIEPRWYIFEECENLIAQLPALIYDETDKEDVSDKCVDHAPEAARYGLMTRPAKAREPEGEKEYKAPCTVFGQKNKKRGSAFFRS